MVIIVGSGSGWVIMVVVLATDVVSGFPIHEILPAQLSGLWSQLSVPRLILTIRSAVPGDVISVLSP